MLMMIVGVMGYDPLGVGPHHYSFTHNEDVAVARGWRGGWRPNIDKVSSLTTDALNRPIQLINSTKPLPDLSIMIAQLADQQDTDMTAGILRSTLQVGLDRLYPGHDITPEAIAEAVERWLREWRQAHAEAIACGTVDLGSLGANRYALALAEDLKMCSTMTVLVPANVSSDSPAIAHLTRHFRRQGYSLRFAGSALTISEAER